ncbi:MAG: hypothetical protein OXG74_02195 [Acidobacteria bacterium]|nr:hypothetical protein [Acidobacteriota bacterium]
MDNIEEPDDPAYLGPVPQEASRPHPFADPQNQFGLGARHIHGLVELDAYRDLSADAVGVAVLRESTAVAGPLGPVTNADASDLGCDDDAPVDLVISIGTDRVVARIREGEWLTFKNESVRGNGDAVTIQVIRLDFVREHQGTRTAVLNATGTGSLSLPQTDFQGQFRPTARRAEVHGRVQLESNLDSLAERVGVTAIRSTHDGNGRHPRPEAAIYLAVRMIGNGVVT